MTIYLSVATWPAGGLLVWPALSFVVLSIGYAGVGARIFSKSPVTGRLSNGHTLLLFPYLVVTSIVWHFMRTASRENNLNYLTGVLIIGRRLMLPEYPDGIKSVVDMTAEFNAVIPVGVQYRLFASLDAAPIQAPALFAIVGEISKLPPPVYLHCAQGHGRTSLVAAAYLMTTNPKLSVADALKLIATVRPAARPNSAQLVALLNFEALLAASRAAPLSGRQKAVDPKSTPTSNKVSA